jgi:hypothetical protein
MTGAILHGFTANQILSHLSNRYPQYRNAIFRARAAGFAGDQILRQLQNNSGKEKASADSFLTENEKTQRNYTRTKKKAQYQALGVLATTAAVGAGAYRLSQAGQAIRPSAIYPPGPGAPPQLGGPQANPRLPFNPQGPNQQQQSPQGPAPQGGLPTRPPRLQSSKSGPTINLSGPQAPRDHMKSIQLIQNLGQENRFNMILRSIQDPNLAASALRKSIPSSVRDILDKSEGGIEQLSEDYKQYLQSQPPKKQYQGAQYKEPESKGAEAIRSQEPENQIEQPQNQLENVPRGTQEIMPEQAQENQTPEEIQAKNQPQEIPQEQPIQELPKQKSNIIATPEGVGEIKHDGKSGVIAEVNGKQKSFKHDDIQREPPDTEEAVRILIDSIPENMKSTNLETAIHIPLEGLNMMLIKFYGGKWAWYRDVSPELYKSIALGTYEPKTQGKTGIGEYKPGVVDSRGAGFSSEISRNPKYAKDTKGIMWGYADSDYDLMKHIDEIKLKIAKERYDETGNIKIPKKRKKST